MSIFFTIFLIIFGILFLGWGLYQIKTGKMVAKRKQPTIDEPREVGVLFSLLGILLFILSLPTYFHDKPKDDRSLLSVIYLVGIAIFLIFFIYVFVYNLKNHRLFAIKKDKAINPLAKHYSVPFSVILLTDAIVASVLLALITFPVSKEFTGISMPVLILIMAFSVFSVVYVLYVNIKISTAYKKSLKKPAKKSKKK